MKAVILAGGVRSGLELGGNAALPRALWPFPAEPLITQVLRFLARHGVTHMAICANGKTKLIASELDDGSGRWTNLHYSEDSFPRGPAGCLRDLHDWLGDEPFLAVQGTAYYQFDLSAMLREHYATRAAITVAATVTATRSGSEILQPAGAYVLSPAVLALVSPVGYQDIKEQLLPKAAKAGLAVRCHRIAGQVHLIHGCRHYLHALGALLQHGHIGPPPEMSEVKPTFWRHASARIAPSARVTGPAWIDREATVDAGAVLIGPVVLGPGVHVGAGALVNRVVAMRGAYIHAGVNATDTILAPATVLHPTPHPRANRPGPDRRAEGPWLSPHQTAMPVAGLLGRDDMAPAEP